MTRQEYLAQLRNNLSSLPEAERESALVYYEEFFEDAANDDEAIKTLGSAESVAQSIIADQNRTEKSSTEYIPAKIDEKVEEAKAEKETAPTYFDKNGEKKSDGVPKKDNNDRIILIIVLILTFPLWIGALGALFGILCGFLAVVLALVIASVALVAAGIVVFGSGIPTLFVSPAAGCILFAVGAIVLSVGAFLSIPSLWLCGEAVPAVFRGIGMLFRKIFGIEKGEKSNA